MKDEIKNKIKNKINKFNELIIGSGGLNGLSYVGSLDIINIYYPLKNFTYLTGCSAGALICALINIHYTTSEIKNIILNIDFTNFFDIKLMNIINLGGFVETTLMRNLIKSIFLTKKIDQNITFNELYILTNKILTINSVNQTLNRVEYFNYINSPNMKVIDGLMMSINIPLICTPILYNQHKYYDGAILDPYPYHYHKNTNKLGIMIYSRNIQNFMINNENNIVCQDNKNVLLGDTFNTIFLLYYNYLKLLYKKKLKNTIYIIDEMATNVLMNTIEKEKLINKGNKKTHLFFQKKIKLKKKRYLLQKYFYLFKYLVFHESF
jgi:predicted acylesterase/phospholipase RssA